MVVHPPGVLARGAEPRGRRLAPREDRLFGRPFAGSLLTHAAIVAMEAAGVKPAIVAALRAAQARARELGDAFGA